MRFLFPLLALLLTASAQENLFVHIPSPTFEGDRTIVEVDALISQTPPSGFLPVRVTAVNQRKSDERILLQFESRDAWGNEGGRMESEFSLEIPAGSTTSRDLLVPVVTRLKNPGYRQDVTLQSRLSGSLGTAMGQINGGFGKEFPAVAMSEPLHSPNASSLDTEQSRLTGHGGSSTFGARFDALRMPEEWRAFSGFDVVMMTDDDWTKAGPGARTALLQWCRLGGRLEIHRLHKSTSVKSLDLGESSLPGYGLGEIELFDLPATHALDAAATVDRFSKTKLPNQARSLLEDYSRSWPLHLTFGSQPFNYALFVVVLIGFGVLVGPVNLFVFAKSGRRHRLFLTTPLIAIGTSLLLVALILMRDGTGGRGTRVALVEVRPDEHTAYVHQEQVSRTGVLFGGSFELDESATISPVPLSGSAWARLTKANGGGGMSYQAAFTDDGLRLGGDWFQSRSEQGQALRAVVPTRGRIELAGSPERPQLVSTFAHPIEKLYYFDRSGSCRTASGLEPGTTVETSPATEADYEAFLEEAHDQLGRRHAELLRRAVARRGGHFVAITGEAPGIETFDAIRWTATTTILTGPLARTTD